MKTTAAFPEPQHTQTPNNFFDMIPDMTEAELRVTLVMIRNTFGWHRNDFKMGVSKLAKAAGLSRQGALDGAAAAEDRGTFRRTNAEAITEAEWELVVALQPVDPSNELTPTLQPVEGNPLVSGGQVGVKESKESKESPRSEKPEIDKVAEWLKMSQWPGAKKALRVDSILSYFGVTLRRTTTSREWEDFAKWVDEKQQKHGQKMEVFLAWLLGQKDYDPQFWPVKKMMEFWPSAFCEPVPSKSSVEETRKKIESEDWRKRS